MIDDRWQTVGRAGDFRSGRIRVFTVGGRDVAVVRFGDRWHAFSNRCPHNGLPLDGGWVEGTIITCRWHGWRFDLASGNSPDVPADVEGPRLRIYPLRVVGDDVQIELPAPG